MKRKIYFSALIFAFVVFGGTAFVNNNTYSQEAPAAEIPFFDHDGDGINDLIQNYRGIAILNRIERRQELKSMNNEEKQELRDKWQKMTEEEREQLREERMQLCEDWENLSIEEKQKQFEEKFNEMVDTDNDGTPDTKSGYLFQNHRFRIFDGDRDGKQDVAREEFRERIKEMREQRMQEREPKNQNNRY